MKEELELDGDVVGQLALRVDRSDAGGFVRGGGVRRRRTAQARRPVFARLEVLRGVTAHGGVPGAREQAGVLDRERLERRSRLGLRGGGPGRRKRRQGRLVERGVGAQPGDGLVQAVGQLTAGERRQVGRRRLGEAEGERLVDGRPAGADVRQAGGRLAFRRAGRATGGVVCGSRQRPGHALGLSRRGR